MEIKIRRTLVTVYLKSIEMEDQFQTYINLEPFDAAKYYLGNKFTVMYSEYEYKLKCMKIRCDGVQEWGCGKWNDIQHEDATNTYHYDAGNIICSKLY